MKEFKFIIDGHKYTTAVNEIGNNLTEVTVNGTTFKVQIEKEELPTATAPRRTVSQVINQAQQSTGIQAVKSPLPGSIVKVNVKVGDKVSIGDELLTMESMKMENSIKAEVAGTVKVILAEPGKNVMQDDKLLEIETTATTTTASAPAATPAPKTAPKVASAPTPAPSATITATIGTKVTSPLPGSVIKVLVTEGQSVKKGDTLLTLESMKMENSVLAEQDGVIKQIVVSAGQNVMQDDLLIVLA